MAIMAAGGMTPRQMSDYYGSSIFNPLGEIKNYHSPPPAPKPVSSYNRLAKLIYEKNLAAEKEMKARDTEQAALNKQAYEAGMMSDEEYQGLESKGFETTRAQFGHVGREFGETAYGRLNTGALRAGAREIKMKEAEAIGGGVRELGLERLRRKSEASRIYAGAEQTRQSQYQIPRYDIPQTMDPVTRATAIGGPAPAPTLGTQPGGTVGQQEYPFRHRPLAEQDPYRRY
ncbi:MAG: hypothetical protein KAV18_02610 [Candidatus Omnitrophica bacterium]|nr:hypothetical protein [Candidatus Omnitrophota bacterium]